MKICPLITQVSILDEPRGVILLGEADDTDLHDEETGKEIFMNPDQEASGDEDSHGDSDVQSEEDGGEEETGSDE